MRKKFYYLWQIHLAENLPRAMNLQVANFAIGGVGLGGGGGDPQGAELLKELWYTRLPTEQQTATETKTRCTPPAVL